MMEIMMATAFPIYHVWGCCGQKKQKRRPLWENHSMVAGAIGKRYGRSWGSRVWPHRKTQELDNQMTPPSNVFDPTRALGFHMRPERNINIFRFPPIPSSFQIVNLHFFAYCFIFMLFVFSITRLFAVCNGDLPRTAYHFWHDILL